MTSDCGLWGVECNSYRNVNNLTLSGEFYFTTELWCLHLVFFINYVRIFTCVIVITAVAASAPRKSLGSNSANSPPSSQCSTPGQFQPTSLHTPATWHAFAHDFIYSFTAKNKYAGGNPVYPRPTPKWQKGIEVFFGEQPRKPEKENLKPQEVEDDEEAGGSGMSKASRK